MWERQSLVVYQQEVFYCVWSWRMQNSKASHVSEEGEGHTFKWRQVNRIWSHCVCAVRSSSASSARQTGGRGVKTRRWRQAGCLVGLTEKPLLPDSGQEASLPRQRDDIKAHSPAPLSDLLGVKPFHSHSWGRQSFTGFLDQGGFTHTCGKKKRSTADPWGSFICANNNYNSNRISTLQRTHNKNISFK